MRRLPCARLRLCPPPVNVHALEAGWGHACTSHASAPPPPPLRRQVFEACLARSNVLRLEACILGADDLQASLGLKRQQGTGKLASLFKRWAEGHCGVHC